MAKNYKDKLKELYQKLKGIKNIEIIIAIVVIAIIILMYSFISTDKASAKTTDNKQNLSDESSLTDQLEKDLAQILSQIRGAGKIEVMITYGGSTERVIANTKSIHTNSSNSSGGTITTSTNTVTETPIIISSNGESRLYVVKEIMPEITGVIVVAEGASSAKVRLELMRAVQTLLDINANSIEIFAMK